jgi:hypothetical protein
MLLAAAANSSLDVRRFATHSGLTRYPAGRTRRKIASVKRTLIVIIGPISAWLRDGRNFSHLVGANSAAGLGGMSRRQSRPSHFSGVSLVAYSHDA